MVGVLTLWICRCACCTAEGTQICALISHEKQGKVQLGMLTKVRE